MRGAGARFRALTALYATDLYTAIRAVQLEMANMPGGRINERSCAIRDVAARDSYVARRWRDGRVSRQPGATTTLEPTFAFKRAVYDA